jgi:hypothetical protein
VTPDIVNPAPVRVAVLMVTGLEPEEVRTRGCVAGSFNPTLPKAMLLALTLSVGPAAPTFNCRAKLSEMPPALAVNVTACALVTDETVAVNAALVALAATVTVAGTLTAALLLDRLTLSPPLGAAASSVTLHASLPDPVMDALLHESALSSAVVAVAPVPLKLTTTVGLPQLSLLVMLNCPEAAPVVAGSK